jgi:hypothetical protein
MTVPQYSVYSSSKRALLGFSLTARAEFEKDRIVVSEIYPFITATNFGKNRMEIRRAAGRHPTMPRATNLNSRPVSSCKPLKKARLSISQTIACVKWPAPPRMARVLAIWRRRGGNFGQHATNSLNCLKKRATLAGLGHPGLAALGTAGVLSANLILRPVAFLINCTPVQKEEHEIL